MIFKHGPWLSREECRGNAVNNIRRVRQNTGAKRRALKRNLRGHQCGMEHHRVIGRRCHPERVLEFELSI